MNYSISESSICIRRISSIALTRHETHGLIFLSVVNALCACPTFLANLLVLLVICLKPNLRCNSINLLGALAVTDLLVGLLVQPLFVAHSTHIILYGVEGCLESVSYDLLSLLTGLYSAITSLAVTVDRCVAVQYPYMYETIVTPPRLVFGVLLSWFIWAAYVSARLLFSRSAAFVRTFLIVRLNAFLVAVLVTTAVYIKLFFISLKHENAISSQEHPTEEQRTATRERKALKTAVYVVGAYIVCYLPFTICLLFFAAVKQPRRDRFMPYMSVLTLVFINSLLNPIIYWWRIPRMRKSILELLKMKRGENNVENGRCALGNMATVSVDEPGILQRP